MLSRKPEPGGIREFLEIAIPLAVSNGTLSLMMVTDRIFLARYSVDAFAASLPSSILSWTLMSFWFGTIGYINVFVAQYHGAGRPASIGRSVWQGVFISFLGSLTFIPAILGAQQFFEALDYPAPVVEQGTAYFQVLGLGALPALINSALACTYSGRGKTLPVLGVNLVAMIFNFVADYALIFGHFGMPEYGVRGAALATILASCISVVCWIIVLWSDTGIREFQFGAGLRFDGLLLGRILWFGIPNGITMCLEAGMFNVFIALVGQLGRVELAATNLAFTLSTLAFVPMVGFMIALETLVGRRIGEGRPDIAQKTTLNAAALCSLYMSFWVGIFLLFPQVIVHVFQSADPEEFQGVEVVAVQLMRFVAAYTVFDGLQIIFGGAIRGAGDTRFSMIFWLGSELFVLIIPTYVLLRYFGGGLFTAWTCITAWLIVMAVGFIARFIQGKWKSMTVIEHAPPDDVSVLEPAAAAPQEIGTR
ncbi:MATE family efflux transporter [bacterium]|jgi:multidrug resistance protein, MATE family|nr:MATE family efflux transporter [bacterium]